MFPIKITSRVLRRSSPTEKVSSADAMRKRRPSSKVSGDEQLRRQLQSLPKEKLVELALTRMVSDPQLRSAGDRPVGQALVAGFDRAMNVRFVEWRALSSYMGQLKQLLDDAHALAQVNPIEALAVIEHFIAAVPKVFDNVHDECELAEFCDSLAEAAIRTARKAKAEVVPLAKSIIDAFIADGTMRWSYALRSLERLLKGGERRQVAEYANMKASTADKFFVRSLQDLAAKFG